MNSIDVPIRSAATVMLVEDKPDLQVFMMERNANTIFAGGMWVFPGGSVDGNDHPGQFEPYCTHRSDIEASQMLGLERGGLAYYVAAIREAFEEAGILLALHKNSGISLDIKTSEDQARYDAHRDRVNEQSDQFLSVIESENLLLDVGQMHYVARWITPEGPPRRFDARFFVSRMPTNQNPRHDDHELVHCAWYSPHEILERERAGDMVLMSPTLRMIRTLARFDSADDVIAAAEQVQPDERARINAERELVLPGDPGYDDGDENIETGWVRLRPL
jgi:8-oxo-dGTP pyrophosphatase MutT (NUDIX family)